jgi:hypothetical protein
MEYKFSGNISLSDYIAFNNYVLKEGLFKGWKLALSLCALFIFIVAIITFLFIYKLSIIIFIPICALFVALFYLFLNRTYKKHYNSNKFYLEEQYFAVNEASIKINSESAAVTLTKENINKIVCRKNVIYIFPALNMAYIIKDTFLPDVNEFENLKRFVSENFAE